MSVDTIQGTASAPQAARVLDMITAAWVSQSIYAVAKLGVADHMAHGPAAVGDVAHAVGATPDALYRLLRTLAAEGLFTEVAEGRFALTPLGAVLRSDAPGSLRALAVMCGEEYFHAWADVLHSARTGTTAWEKLYGVGVFPYLDAHPASAVTYNAAMTGFAVLAHTAVADAYDFGPVRTLVDVGGGHGTLLAAVMARHSTLRGVLFDRTPVVAGAREAMGRKGLSDRCDFAVGDFFTEIVGGADAYVLSTIIHEWDDPTAVSILQNVRRAMTPDGRLLLVEMVIPVGDVPTFGKRLDAAMLVCTGGRERTEAEYRQLFAAAGFTLTRVVPTRSPMSVLEGFPTRN